jgi:hypothetical protein
LEIKPTKIIKGQGLEKMMTETNQEAIEVGQKERVNIIVSEIENNEWYLDIIYYLKNLTCPDNLKKSHETQSHELFPNRRGSRVEKPRWGNP